MILVNMADMNSCCTFSLVCFFLETQKGRAGGKLLVGCREFLSSFFAIIFAKVNYTGCLIEKDNQTLECPSALNIGIMCRNNSY